MRGVHFAFAALLAGVALAAAACGGGGGGGGTESSTTTTEATETSTTTTGTESTTTTSTEAGTLEGEVGEEDDNDAFTITLKKDGADVTTLTPGTYTLKVEDYSTIHNFHITGPGVDESTSVGETGEKTFTITLQDGTYNYVCDPHASQMTGSFTVSG